MKKHLLILAYPLVLYSCTFNSDGPSNKLSLLSENEKRKFFTDSISRSDYYQGKFSRFIEQYYPDSHFKGYAWQHFGPFQYALEEDLADTSHIDSLVSWFRVTIIPPYGGGACLVKLEKKNNNSYLSWKLSDGAGDFFPGILMYSFTQKMDTLLYDSIYSVLQSINFWNSNYKDNECFVLDGESFLFEAVQKGKYNYTQSYAPTTCGGEQTKRLYFIYRRLADLTGLKMAHVSKFPIYY